MPLDIFGIQTRNLLKFLSIPRWFSDVFPYLLPKQALLLMKLSVCKILSADDVKFSKFKFLIS